MKREKDVCDEWNRSHYSIAQNLCYCLGNTAKCYFPLLCWCVIAILADVALSVLSAFLPKVVIEKITAGNSLLELVMVIALFMGCIAMLSGIRKFFTQFIFHQKLRMNTFYLKCVTLKGLTTDYSNQENGIFRKLQTESMACCNGNYSPLTSIYDILIRLCTSALGLSVFTAILAQLNVLAILFLVVTTAISYFLNQRIIQWMDQNNYRRIGYEQRMNYINTASSDIRSAKDIRLYRMAVWFSDIYQDNMRGIAEWYRQLTSKIFGVAVCDSGFALLREGVTYFYLSILLYGSIK